MYRIMAIDPNTDLAFDISYGHGHYRTAEMAQLVLTVNRQAFAEKGVTHMWVQAV